jgi:hypothetical protein
MECRGSSMNHYDYFCINRDPMNIVFFKKQPVRKFNYHPRYYDPVKEEMEQRRRELGLSHDMDHRERFRAEMHRKWTRGGETGPSRSSIIRVIMYACLGFMVIYVVFFTDLIQNLIQLFLAK